MQQSLISIIIPVYNVEKFLPDCFTSIENQSYKNLEIIFVNDGSTDNSKKIIEEFCLKNKNAKIINQTNQGICFTRNVGLSHATGDFIYFLDPDDIIHPETIEFCKTSIDKEQADLAICEIVNINENQSYDKLNFKKLNKNYECIDNHDLICAKYLSTRKGVTNKLFRTSTLKLIPKFPNVADLSIIFGEDINIVCNFLLYAKKIIFADAQTYYWRKRKSSETTKEFSEMILSSIDAYKPFYNLDKNNYPITWIYIKSARCIMAFYLLYRIKNSHYSNSSLIKEIYKVYKDNLKYLKKSKMFSWYIKHLFKFSKPIAYFYYKKALKK